jgi:hypothetical protein
MSDSVRPAARLSGDTQRSLVILALLTLALLAVVALYGRDLLAAPAGDHHTFVADIDRWRRTNRERTIEARYDFSLKADLKALPLQVGAWQGADIPQTNVEVAILLEPEQYVYRRYTRADGKYVWLSLIGSRQTKSFHSPQICYTADGWQTDVTSEPVELDEGSLYMLAVEARKDPWEHIILYTFLYPDSLRQAEDGAILFKVTAPLAGSAAETLALEKSFIREFFHSARL